MQGSPILDLLARRTRRPRTAPNLVGEAHAPLHEKVHRLCQCFVVVVATIVVFVVCVATVVVVVGVLVVV